MKKRNLKWLWIALAVVLAAGGISAAIILLQQNREHVYVYGFSEGIVGMTDYYEGSNESSGMVTTDRIQTVFLSETQSVQEILVEDGQKVKKGDILFTYDTTLSDITLMKKDLAVQQAKLDLQTAEKELRVINSYVPIRYYEVVQPEPTEPPEPIKDLTEFDLTDKDYLAYSGSGSTSLTPKYCWLRSTTMVDDKLMQAMFEGVSEDVLFMIFRTTEGDKADGAFTGEYGIKLMRLTVTAADGTAAYTYRFSFYDPKANQAPPAPVDPGVEWNSGYTSAEIAQMRREKQEQIKDLAFQIKMEEAEFKIMQKEADSGEVTAEFDGVIMSLIDAENASESGLPLMKVSGGGGFYVEGQISELQLGSVQPGQTVTVMSWDTGMSYEGSVVEIGYFPIEQGQEQYGYSQNVSYYPYRVFIDESADLQDGLYVSMSFRAQEGKGGLYIDGAFVRTEGTRAYVYARGADGLLEKRFIRTGKNLWGSYMEVLDGLTEEDYIAFPYGKSVKPGVPTQEGTYENLYQ